MNNMNKSKPYSLNELELWKKNPTINPRTNKKIKINGATYIMIEKEYNQNKDLIEKEPIQNTSSLNIINQLLQCEDDRDPISMNIFWIVKDNIKSIVYPLEELNKLIFYTDSHKKLRCLEKESISYFKTYNILNHPVTMEPLPESLFETIKSVVLETTTISIDDTALNVFQIFAKKSIFIDYKLFMNLDKSKLLTFNSEIKDIWVQNLTPHQRNAISDNIIFNKSNSELSKYNLVDIQKYLLNDMTIALECNKEELSIMINYIIIGALGIVIPEIKENYSDVIFGFS